MPASAKDPLNAALAVKSLESQVNAEGAPFSESADLLIVPPPGKANLNAVVLVLDAEAVPHRLETVGEGQRVLVLVGEVDYGCSEQRPVALEQHPSGEPQFLDIAEILDRRIDVPVELQVADLGVGLVGADGEVHLVPANREGALVDAITVGDVDEAAVAD